MMREFTQETARQTVCIFLLRMLAYQLLTHLQKRQEIWEYIEQRQSQFFVFMLHILPYYVAP